MKLLSLFLLTLLATLASTAASIASPQRYMATAFNLLEEMSLDWLAQMFGLDGMKGIYSGGGSVANLVRLEQNKQLPIPPPPSTLNRSQRTASIPHTHGL